MSFNLFSCRISSEITPLVTTSSTRRLWNRLFSWYAASMKLRQIGNTSNSNVKTARQKVTFILCSGSNSKAFYLCYIHWYHLPLFPLATWQLTLQEKSLVWTFWHAVHVTREFPTVSQLTVLMVTTNDNSTQLYIFMYKYYLICIISSVNKERKLCARNLSCVSHY